MQSTTAIPAATSVSAPATLGERIRAARRSRGLSQAQLAGEELTKGFISQVESGLVRPSLRSLTVIANRLNKPLDYFLGDESIATPKRVTFHRLAAEAASERSDWTALRSEVAEGLQHSPEPHERARLLNLLAAADIAEVRHEDAFSRIAEALAIADPGTDAATVAQLHQRRGVAYFELGQLSAAAESFEAARDIIEQHEVVEPRLRARVLVSLGTVYVRLNRTTKALATYEQALGIATRASDLEVAARGYMGLARALYDDGEFDGAIANYQRALDLWQRLSDTDFELNALQSLAGVHFESNDLDHARAYASRCLSRAEASGDDRWAAVARTELARVTLAEGRAEEALALAHEAEAALESDAQQHAGALRVIGAAEHALGRYDRSDAAYRRGIEIASSVQHFATRSDIAAEYARRLRERGELDRALDLMELARGGGARS